MYFNCNLYPENTNESSVHNENDYRKNIFADFIVFKISVFFCWNYHIKNRFQYCHLSLIIYGQKTFFKIKNYQLKTNLFIFTSFQLFLTFMVSFFLIFPPRLFPLFNAIYFKIHLIYKIDFSFQHKKFKSFFFLLKKLQFFFPVSIEIFFSVEKICRQFFFEKKTKIKNPFQLKFCFFSSI